MIQQALQTRTRARRSGFTLLELLAALALASVLGIALAQVNQSFLADSTGRQAALYQQRLAEAAAKYLAAHRDELLGSATAAAPSVVSIEQMRTAGLLAGNIEPTNAYGQTPCLLVLQPDAGQLEALLVTEGGNASIERKDLAYVAAQSGPGGGYIAYASPLAARGAHGSWSLEADALARYLSASCTGTPAGEGHLASAVFFDASGAASDFVQRSAVPGHAERNRMSTPLHMAAVAAEGDAADARCVDGDASTQGRIAVDAGGRVLSCQSGTWKAQGAGHWKDPVPTFTDLPTDAANAPGDVRMVTALSSAFTWDGSAWQPLAVDAQGNLQVPRAMTSQRLALLKQVVRNEACAPDGSLARDETGLALFCRSGSWRSFLETRVTTQAYAHHFHVGPTDGIYTTTVDLTALPGTRPLLMTASSSCVASFGSGHASVAIEMQDASGATLGYQGRCDINTLRPRDTASTQSNVSLIKLPENAATLRISMLGGTVTGYGDGADLQLVLFNSE